MNRLTLKFFATLRERARTAEMSREFPEGITVGEIWAGLGNELPALVAHRDRVAFAVNHEYVKDDYRPHPRGDARCREGDREPVSEVAARAAEEGRD